MKKIIIGFLFFISAVTLNAQNTLNKDQMFAAQMISVTIGGSFPVTGTFSALITERVDQFITRLFLETKEKTLKSSSDPKIMKKLEAEISNFSLRGIVLKRANGNKIPVDLLKFRTTGDFKYNPYLKNDDVLIFPPNDISRNFFTVSGAVKKPGIFFFVDGDSLSNAIELAMGFNEAYKDINKIAISRVSYNGETMVTDTLDINANIKLQRGDQIKVIAPETQRKNYYVTVIGEVKYPGSVPVTKNNTKLYEVIQKVGGFTDQASLRRSHLYTGNSLAVFLEKQYGIKLAEQPDWEDVQLRNTIVRLETMLMYRMSNVYPADSSYFFLENQLRVLTEGSSLDFTKINDPNSDISKYVVKNRDVIIIPAIQKSVFVFGQVGRPGHVTLFKGKDYKYYIKEAGGLGQLAIKDEIMVIKGGSRFWISPLEHKVKIEEGDYIYVPKERLRSFSSHAVEYSIYVGMLASVATVILVVLNIFK